MIVDTHTHVVAADRRRYPLVTEERRPDTTWYLDDGVTTEQMLDLLGAAGVDRAVLVQPGSTYGDDNRYVVDSTAAHRDRCVGVVGASGHPLAPADVDRLLEPDGVVSLRLFDVGSGVLADPRTIAVAESLAARGAPLVLHADAERFPALLRLLDAVPELDVVLDHGGVPHSATPGVVPWANGTPLAELAARPRLHVKVTPIMFLHVAPADLPKAGRDLVARFGADRLLWGSDYPHSPGPYDALVEQARRFVEALEPTEQAAVLGDTARRLWPALLGP